MVWQAAGIVPCLLSLCVCLCRRLSAACRLPCPGLRCIACTYVVAFLTSPSLLHQREHLNCTLGTFLTVPTYLTEHGTAEPSCGVKTSIRLVFRFGLQQSPGARYSCCRSQSLNSARALCTAPPTSPPPSPSPPPTAISTAVPRPTCRYNPTASKAGLWSDVHSLQSPSASHPSFCEVTKSPTPTLTQPKLAYRNHHMYSRCL
jgi:hypothetical protein